MLITALTVGFAAIIMAVFWPLIRTFFARTVIPAVSRSLGEKFANLVVTVVAWLDDKIRSVRRGFRELLKFVKHNVLGIRIELHREPGSRILKGSQITTLANEETKKEPIELDWDKLPVEWQKPMLKGEDVNVDMKQTILARSKDKLLKRREELAEKSGDLSVEEQEEDKEVEACLAVLES